jgi:hypothetical protein
MDNIVQFTGEYLSKEAGGGPLHFVQRSSPVMTR